jgi:tripartite-type tricarboxylate transporter receptor subunit TctC
MRIILQTTPERIAELPDAPSLGEIGDTPRTSRCSRSMPAPPGLPADRVKALRDAFQKMVKDPEFDRPR